MENRQNTQNSKGSTTTEHLDTASSSRLARKTSRSGTIWGKFSKVFAKKKPKPKAQSKTNSVILPQQLTPLAESKNGYRAGFAEHFSAYAKVENLAILVGLPDWTDENVTITLELNLLSCSTPGRYQEPKPFVCTKETDSETMFTGSLKLRNRSNVLSIMSMPLYLVDSKEAVNSQGVEHETILKTSNDVPYTRNGKYSGFEDVQVSVIFTRLRNVDVSSDANSASNESLKYKETSPMALSVREKTRGELVDHTPNYQAANDVESQSIHDIHLEESGNDPMHLRMRGSGVVLASTPDYDNLSLCNMSTQISSPWDDTKFDNFYVQPWGHCSVQTQYLLTYEDTESAAASNHCDLFTNRSCRDKDGAFTSQCQKCIVNHMSTQHSCNDEEAGPSVPCCKIGITAEVSTQYSRSRLMQDKEVDVQDSFHNMRLPLTGRKSSVSLSSLSYVLGDLNRQKNILCEPKDSNLSSDVSAWPTSSTTTNIGDSSTLPSLVSDESVSLHEKQLSQGFSVRNLENTIEQKSGAPLTRICKISIPNVPREYPPFPSTISNFEGKPKSLLNKELCLTNKIANVNPLGEFARCEVVSNIEVHVAKDPFRHSEQKYQSYYEDNDRYYETHRENVTRYFDDARSPTQQAEVHLGGDSSRSGCDTKMEDFKVCLTKMGDILATTSNSKDIEKSSDAQLSKERLETYEKAENGIQNIIKELLKESGDIKESALLHGAKEESDPPVVLDYIKTKPDYEKLCSVMMDEMGKYSTTVNEDTSVMIGEVLDEIIDKSSEIANSHIKDRADLENETKASPLGLTYFPNSTFTDSKVPKTSYSFGVLACDTCITIASTSSAQQIANDSTGEQAKIECFLAEDVQCHETVERAQSEEEIFQASVSLNSITNMTAEFENPKELPTDDKVMCKETDEEAFIQNIDLIKSDFPLPPTQTECNSLSEQEIFSTVPDLQPSTSSSKEQPSASPVCVALQQTPAIHNIQRAITGKLDNSSGNLMKVKILEDSGNESSDADDETENISPNLNLPKSMYKSKQDLNTPQEIEEIEKNLQDNDTCVRKGEVLFDSQKSPN